MGKDHAGDRAFPNTHRAYLFKRDGKADDIRRGIIDDVNYVKFEYSYKVA